MKTLIVTLLLFLALPVFGQRVLTLSILLEGHYNPTTNTMSEDTIRIYLKNHFEPYDFVDSAKANINSSGIGIFSFNAPNGVYRLIVIHKNSIQTWSRPVTFSYDTASFDFTTSSSQAYRNNLKLKGGRYCIYGGDVNQDEFVDIADNMLVDNDVNNFVTGYVTTDLNGDHIVDINDLSVVDNNASLFVRSITNYNFPSVSIANVTIGGKPEPWITCFHYFNLDTGWVFECDFISTDPDYNDLLWDTAYWTMRDFWEPYYINADISYTPPLEHVGPSPVITHLRLVLHENFIGYIRWKSYDRLDQYGRCVLFFNYFPKLPK